MYMNWQRIPDCWSSLKDTELLNISQSTKVYTESLVDVHNGEPGYYLKRGWESYRTKDYGDRNT